MKRFVSVFLLCALLLSMVPTAFAATNTCVSCGETPNYTIYCANCSEYRACNLCGICQDCGPDTLHNAYDGTMVLYDAEDPDGDGNKDVLEEYVVTVPAKLTPGGQGNVTATGKWPSSRILQVQSESKVKLVNSINSEDFKELVVTFPGISLAGSNTQSVSAVQAVSVAEMPSNALFGTWNGIFYYTVQMTDDPSTFEAYALLLDNSGDPENLHPMIFVRTTDVAVGDTYNSRTYGELPITHVYENFETEVSSGPSSIMGVRPWQNEAELITSVVFEDTVKPLAVGSWFNGFRNCKTFDVAKLDVSQVPNTRYMFASCESVEELDLSTWNVSNVTSIDTMFSGCYALKTVDFTNWDADQITDMSYAFCGCTGLTGELVLDNFNPTWYQSCFWNVDFSAQNLTLKGLSMSLDVLGSTGTGYCSWCNGVCLPDAH